VSAGASATALATALLEAKAADDKTGVGQAKVVDEQAVADNAGDAFATTLLAAMIFDDIATDSVADA
jgi:hypothetical protein